MQVITNTCISCISHEWQTCEICVCLCRQMHLHAELHTFSPAKHVHTRYTNVFIQVATIVFSGAKCIAKWMFTWKQMQTNSFEMHKACFWNVKHECALIHLIGTYQSLPHWNGSALRVYKFIYTQLGIHAPHKLFIYFFLQLLPRRLSLPDSQT